MKIQEILTERLSDVLYHSTSLYNLLRILEQDRFQLTPDLGTDSESQLRKKQKYYYMSFSRSKLSKYHYPARTGMVSVLIVIDGSKLNQKYSGKAIDYWGWANKDEMEDRLYSSEPYIEDAGKYIQEVHILYNDEKEYDASIYMSQLRKSAIIMKQKNIPYYVYLDADSFNLLKKNDAIKVSQLKNPTLDITRWPSGKPTNPFKRWTELLKKPEKNDLNYDTKRLLDKIFYYERDVRNSIKADIHNSRTSESYRPYLDKFLSILKSLNINDIDSLINHLKEKYKSRYYQ